MPSHFSSLGFPPEMDTPYQEQLLETALTGEQLRARDGAYVRWSPGAGIELWLQVQAREVIGLAPHFAGGAAMRVSLTERVSRAGESPLDGAMRAWADPPEGSSDEGEYPFVFDLPDAGRYTGLALPRAATVQLAAFAAEVTCYASESAFDAAQGDGQIRYASESFIPSGLFVDGDEPPSAFAVFAGRVREADRRRNPYSNGEFWCARVRTLGGEIDIVADPAAMTGEPSVGGIVQGSFWLSGKLPSSLADSERAFWRRWLPI